LLTILVPAHKGGTIPGSTARPQILEMLDSLAAQTVQPDRIVVLINNCRDDTPQLAQQAGVEVAFVPPNPDKKAGALNWWLDGHLEEQADEDLLMVMDADTILNHDFLENALEYVAKGYHAVGGVFLGKEGGGFVGMLQRNEYARYARDVQRRKGKALVLTGTATVFTARCLKDVVLGREVGAIPNSAEEGRPAQVYDTKALTEDNELTFAILHLGYAIIAPEECGLKTEVMETWRDLARQRERWKRGAIENNRHYGLTRHTWNYWRLQIWGGVGIVVTMLYLLTVTWALVAGSLHLEMVWMAVSVIYALERFVTVVKRRGALQGLVGAVILVEMPYDIFLQFVQLKAIVSSTFRTSARW
jgi:cellulose synthase/poly-beta-1,6-N-acetylglucosamine synthase-like glycosyltransferase